MRLVGLSMRTGPATAITLSRAFDGGLRLRELEEKIRDDTTVAQGSMRGSLYESAEAARQVLDAVRAAGQPDSSCIVLGRNAPQRQVDHWLTVAAPLEGWELPVCFGVLRSQ